MQGLLEILSLTILQFKKVDVSENKSNSKSTSFFAKDDYRFLAARFRVNYIEKRKFHIVYFADAYLIEYAPATFKSIRLSLNYQNDDILASLYSHDNIRKIASLSTNSGGKSGAFIFSTSDSKFIMKTITSSEKSFFLHQMLKKYSQRITENPTSKMVRILGVYKAMPSKTSFILMECVMAEQNEILIFDLKGSQYNRLVPDIPDPLSPPTGKVLKDHNFSQYSTKIILSPAQRETLIQSLKEDVFFLQSQKIMDYSLLLVIYLSQEISQNRYTSISSQGFYFSIGIIDIFQQYTMKKAGEKKLKSLFSDSQTISAVDPEAYASRFLNSMENVFQ